jgi:hypothetical protein
METDSTTSPSFVSRFFGIGLALISLAVVLGILFFRSKSATIETPMPVSTTAPLPSDSSPAANLQYVPDETSSPKQWNQPPEITIDPKKTYQALLKTEKGDITIDLYADKTPKTVNNFVFLARQKFYDGTIFHRVMTGFMIQGGDPEGTGRGGPGYRFEDESFTGSYTRETCLFLYQTGLCRQ